VATRRPSTRCCPQHASRLLVAMAITSIAAVCAVRRCFVPCARPWLRGSV
jgi:hypothetical protein